MSNLGKKIQAALNRGRKVERGTFSVGVDNRTESVKGRKVTKYAKDGTVKKEKFVAKGEKGSSVKRIKDVTKYQDPSKSKRVYSNRGGIATYDVDGRSYVTEGKDKIKMGKSGLVKKSVTKDKGIGANNPIKSIKKKTVYNSRPSTGELSFNSKGRGGKNRSFG